MLRPLIVGLVLLCSAPWAQARAISPPDVRSLPMQFEWRREGPVDVCKTQCRVWISAIGAITADTPRDFDSFAQDPKVRGAVVVLDSEGGSVLGALELGRSIRRLGMTTTVGKTTVLPDSPGNDPRATLSFDAYCESMCGFTLLAGTRRYVSAEAHVLVHQIWLGDRRNDALAANYSAEDLVLVQRDIGRLAQYTVEMGGDIDLLQTALKIPPWEPMHTLTQDEVSRMHLSTVDTLYDKVTPEVATNAAPVTTVVAKPASINERGWAVVEDSGTTLLARRHPLTIEGDNIGQFDLMLGCGSTPDTYSVTYVENRQNRETQRPPARLKDVSIAIGRNTVPLTLASSDPKRPAQLASIARGSVSSTLIAALADSDSRAVTVYTSNASNAKTVIRVGSSGVAQALPQLAAACSKSPRAHTAQMGL